MKNLPKQILEKLPFDNNKSFNRAVKGVMKKFCCSWTDVVENLRIQGIYDYSTQHVDAKRDMDKPDISIENEKFEQLLHQSNINYSVEFPLGDYFYDFKVENILIEISPSWTHNSTYNVTISRRRVNKLDPDYHYKKAKFAIDRGYCVINVFEWNDVNKLVMALKAKSKFINVFKGVEKHQVKLKSSAKYRSYVINENNQIIKEEVTADIYDDGYELYVE